MEIGDDQVGIARLEHSGKDFTTGDFIVFTNLRDAGQCDEKLMRVLQNPVLLGSDHPRCDERVLLDLAGGQATMFHRAVQSQAKGGNNRRED